MRALVSGLLIFLIAGMSSNLSADDLEDMVFVEGGTFTMGSIYGEDDERPVYKVTLCDFYISKYEVTQQEWVEIMGYNPSYLKGDNLPVDKVNWYEAVEYCNKRSLKEGLSPCYTINSNNVSCDFNANGYRLPTEAEWEFAARGGIKSQGFNYSGSNRISLVAWHTHNSDNKIHEVGRKQPNELGIYDMSGNAWEWCWDWYDEEYPESSLTDPRGPSSGKLGSITRRVLRGGSRYNIIRDCRVTCRAWNIPDREGEPDMGFRVVVSAISVESHPDLSESEETKSVDSSNNHPEIGEQK